MKKLKEFICESYDDYLKLSEDDKKKLLNLDLEYGKIALIAYEQLQIAFYLNTLYILIALKYEVAHMPTLFIFSKNKI